MEKSIYRFILRYSLRQQITLTVLSFASFIPYYYYLTMPKLIVNQGIVGQDIEYPVTVLGITFAQEGYLLLLTFGFLALVVVQQGFKYSINVYQGISGERMLRRLRYELYGRVLRFPLPTFRKVSQGEIIPMITAETESLGGFIANSFALPLFQGGLFLVSLGFLFAQNWMIALAALMLYPVQLYVIPKMQRKVNQLGKERVRAARRLADRIGESIQGVQEVHAHNGAKRLLSEFSQRLGDIYWIRYDIYKRKFMIKFVNNFLQQAGPFLFYSIGGYIAIRGHLDVGTVIASVAAHKEMGAPLKELLNYYQQREDARIKYEQVISQFEPDGLAPPERQLAEPEAIMPLDGEIQAANLLLCDDQGNPILEGISFALPAAAHVAIIGTGGGREELAMLLARLLDPSKGRISIGGTDLATLPEAVLGRRAAYVGSQAYVFSASIEANLYFGLRNRPLRPPEYEGEAKRRYEIWRHEAEASGNSLDDPEADWTDWEAAGAADPKALREVALSTLRKVEFYDDVYVLGMRGGIDPAAEPDLAAAILRARALLGQRLAEPGFAKLVESWDRGRFNSNASVAENLMFGFPVGDGFAPERLALHPYVQQVLERTGLTETFLRTGYDVAATMVELFADLPPDHEFFQQYSFISSDELPEFQELTMRTSRERLGELKDADRLRLMSLPFMLIPARHRLGHIDEAFMASILEAREVFARDLPPELAGSVGFFDPERYTPGASLQDNVLFGKVVYGQAQAVEQVGALLGAVIDELGLRDTVAGVGLGFECGVAGGRLSGTQRQKLALARAILKRPDMLVLSDATGALDNAAQGRIMDALFNEFDGRRIIWSLQRPDLARRFDQVLVLESGRLAEQGSPQDLDREGTLFNRLAEGS